MLAQSFFQYLYWTEGSVKRAQTEPRREAEEYLRWKQQKAEESQTKGYWDIPYVREQEAVEQAAQMADRHNRLFLRTLTTGSHAATRNSVILKRRRSESNR